MPSTAIRDFSYDADAQALDVEFITHKRYRYFDVPEGVFDRFRGAFSKGVFFNANIRDAYRYERLRSAA